MTDAPTAAAGSPPPPSGHGRISSGVSAALLMLLRLMLVAMVVLVLLTVGLLIAVATVDWNRARPYVSRHVTELTGRQFAIGGDFKVGFSLGPPTEAGWHRYMPRLRLSGQDVRFGNPSWASTGPDLATAKRITATLHPLSLLAHRVVITDLAMEAPMLALERDARGRRSWRLHNIDSDAPSPWRLEIQHASFANGDLTYINRLIDLELRGKVSSIEDVDPRTNPVATTSPATTPRFGLQFTASGTYRRAHVTGSGKAGGLLELTDNRTRYPIKVDALLGKNKASIDGTLDNPRKITGLDLQLTLGGDSMADLYPVTDVLLPETPAYQTRGRLVGTQKTDVWLWRYENFTGRVGDSDLAGTAEYLPRQPDLPRPLLRGTITSQQLRLADLGPSVGVGASGGARKTQQPAGKALPVAQFHSEKWKALDADVTFKGKRLVRSAAIPLQDVEIVIRMHDSVLSLAPVNFGLAGGNVTANITLDGRKKPIAAQLKLAARKIKVRELFPKLKSMQASFGEINGDAALTGHGNSVSDMLATSNGELGAVVSEGSVSQFILEAAGLNIANAVFAKVFGDKQVHLNCMVSDFAVNSGRAEVRRFMLDTDDARVDVTGSVDLGRELLDLDVRPRTKGVRIFSLRTPLYAKGSFQHPDIGPYKGPLALKAAAAGALAVLSPLAAVLPLVNLGDVPDGDCRAALAKAGQTRARPQSEPTSAPAKPVTQGDMQKSQQEK